MKEVIEDSLLIEIESICSQGRLAWGAGDIGGAEVYFLNAWNKIPIPRPVYDYSQEIASGMVIFYRDTGQSEKALQWMTILEECYNTKIADDSELSFLAATVHVGLGNEREAYEIFHKLYLKFGRRPFQGEDQKYFSFYKKYSESVM